MKHQTKKNLVGSICYIIVFVLILTVVCTLLERKESREEYAEFWSNPKDYDVWLLGTSHVRFGLQVMELYSRYGISSYCLAAPSSGIPQTYWTFMNALQYAQPKMVVLDCYKAGNKEKISEDIIESMHAGLDSIPFSRTKVQMTMDLFETTEQKMEFLFNFYVYHNRWDELDRDDFVPENSVLKGGRISGRITDMSKFHVIDETDMLQEETVAGSYLRKIIEECEKREIPIILTAIPCCISDQVQRDMNSVVKFSEEYGIPFFNMMYEEKLHIDFQTDFKDKGHLNCLGAQKVTSFIGEYLEENYDFLTAYRSEEAEKKWEQDYAKYRNSKIEWIQQEKKLEYFLTWLADENYSCEMYQHENAEPGSRLEKLLEQIENKHIITYKEAVSAVGKEFEGEFAVIVKDTRSGEVIDTAIFQEGIRQK